MGGSATYLGINLFEALGSLMLAVKYPAPYRGPTTTLANAPTIFIPEPLRKRTILDLTKREKQINKFIVTFSI